MKILPIILIFFTFIIIGNLVLLDYFFVSQRNDLLDLQTRVTTQSDTIKKIGQRLYAPTDFDMAKSQPQTTCPLACDAVIKAATSAIKPVTQLVAPVTSSPAAILKGEFFIPLGQGSISIANTWTDLFGTQTTFDTTNFNNIVAAFFEASLRVKTGEVQVRLYDSTTPAVFWTSVLKSSSTTGETVSLPVKLFSGKKTYRVQIMSTMDTGYLDQARIRIITQ